VYKNNTIFILITMEHNPFYSKYCTHYIHILFIINFCLICNIQDCWNIYSVTKTIIVCFVCTIGIHCLNSKVLTEGNHVLNAYWTLASEETQNNFKHPFTESFYWWSKKCHSLAFYRLRKTYGKYWYFERKAIFLYYIKKLFWWIYKILLALFVKNNT
jgi:hypothetical protein